MEILAFMIPAKLARIRQGSRGIPGTRRHSRMPFVPVSRHQIRILIHHFPTYNRGVRSILFSAIGFVCLGRMAFSQPAFEVATIKPFDTRNGVSNAGVRVYPGGRLVIHALPLKALITAAYNLSYWQLSGGEDWMEKEAYDVEAKPSAQSGTYSLRHTRNGIGDDRLRLMLRTLLAERFQLTLRRQTVTGPVYLMETSGKALLLHATKYTEDQPAFGSAGVFRGG